MQKYFAFKKFLCIFASELITKPNIMNNSKEKLKQAKQLENLIEDQENMLRYFQNGKISKISVRQFNNHNCEFEEEDYAENIPRSILKKVMVDFLKKDIENLNNKLDNLFK